MPHKSVRIFYLLFFCLSIAAVWSFYSLQPRYSPTPSLEVWALDVGQGESVLIREPGGKKLLFDGGPDTSVLSQLGSVLPLWEHTLDLVILSHNHSDHIRGLISVLAQYQVKEVWLSGAIYTTNDYKTFIKDLQAAGIQPKLVYFDPTTCTLQVVCPALTPFGQINIQVYHPLQDMTGKLPGDQHDATVSIKVSYGEQSVLLPGDLNETHEQNIIQACPTPECTLLSTILQIPHHGSATGLSPAFLQAVSPSSAFIPVGLNNKFNHPAPTILKKLEAVQIPTYRTDIQGRIHYIISEGQFQVSHER